MTVSTRRGCAMFVILALACGASACDEDQDNAVGDAVQDSAVGDDCSQDALSGDDDTVVFTSAYRVGDGALDALCFGEDDSTIVAAWNDLATIAPPEQLSDLALFGGFEPEGDEAAETLAFVNALDDGSQFQMSVNTVEANADPDELLLTLAHEFSHVFTATTAQLAFSAFVFGLEPGTGGQAQRLQWIGEQPGLAEFRNRADAAEMTPLANNFELCG